MHATPTPAAASLLADAPARLGLADPGRLAARIDRHLSAGGVRDPAAYARQAAFHAAAEARRRAAAAERRRAKAEARFEAEAAATAAANLLRSEFERAMARLPNASRRLAAVALRRKFDGWGDGRIAAEFGGASRAARDQWACRGAKAVVSAGVSAELEAFLCRRG